MTQHAPAPSSVLKITDATTPDELREAITHLSHDAARCMPVVGWVDREGAWHETAWDRAHGRISALLDELEVMG